jgi:hypothetical protein
MAVLLVLVVLLSLGSGLYAGASFFPQQAPNVTVTTTIFTTTTSWTTSTIWSTVTSVVYGVWTTIQYTTSTSTVTLTASPTNVGKTDIGATDNLFSGGYLKAYKYTMSGAGTVQSITVYIQAYGSGAKIRVGIYNDNSNYPGSLVAGNDEWTVGATGWKTITLATHVYLSAGNYWIGLLVEKASAQTVTFKATTGAGTQLFEATGYSSLPSKFDAGVGASSYSDSIYFTYV